MKRRRTIYDLLAALDRPAPRSTRAGIVLLAVILALDVFAAFVAGHMLFGFCLLHMRRYPVGGDIPVVYGFPNVLGDHDTDALQRSRRGEIVLGGAAPRSIAAVCPYCRWPTRIRDPHLIPPPIPLQPGVLDLLDPDEATAVRLQTFAVTRAAQGDIPDRVTSALVTEADVWIGTWFAGLHRYDRTTRQWLSLQPQRRTPVHLRIPGLHIQRVWRTGDAVCVQHADAESPGFLRTHHTSNRGRTWIPGAPPASAGK